VIRAPLAVVLALAAPLATALAPDVALAPRYTLSPAAVAQSLAAHPDKQHPFRYAVPVEADLGLAAGQWIVENGVATWRLRIQSAGAQSLSAHLTHLALPPGASLRIVDPKSGFAHAPYLPGALRRAGEWSPLVIGDELMLEARMPAAVKARFTLDVATVYHGTRDWKAASVQAKSSGSCNVNVACSEGDAWRDEARSVALLTIANQYLCTGELLNNVRQDKAALFITANHCGIGAGEDDVGPASSVNSYFNYQAASCNAPPAGSPPVPDTQGATFLADDVQSDFTLLRLNTNGANRLPVNAYYAGWSALGAGSDSGVAIHHPSGDEKKISTYASAISESAADIGQACPVDAWQVQWSEGTTEPGSSGGGLWSATHHLIGTLSGGNASCGNLSGADYFARFDRGWTANAEPGHQLKAWLDPDGTCIAEIAGLDPQASPDPSPITSGPTRCEGAASAGCGGSGGAATFAPLFLLAALARWAARVRSRA
jgi:lysyl endopeptidase